MHLLQSVHEPSYANSKWSGRKGLVQQGFNLQHFGLTSWKSVTRKGCLSAHPIDQKPRGLISLLNSAVLPQWKTSHRKRSIRIFWLLPPKSCTSKRISWLALGNKFKVLTGSDKKRVTTRQLYHQHVYVLCRISNLSTEFQLLNRKHIVLSCWVGNFKAKSWKSKGGWKL